MKERCLRYIMFHYEYCLQVYLQYRCVLLRGTLVVRILAMRYIGVVLWPPAWLMVVPMNHLRHRILYM